MTGARDEERGARQEPPVTLVLQGYEVYLRLFLDAVLFCVVVLLFRWPFVRLAREPLDLESLGVQGVAGFLFIIWVFGVPMYGYAKAVLILLYSAKRVLWEGDTIVVERVLGHWHGPAQDLRLRKGSFGWLGTLGSTRYQLVLPDGRLVAEIIWLRNLLEEGIKPRRSLEENVALLRQWVADAEEGQQRRFQLFYTGVTKRLKDRLSFLSRKWPGLGKILWWSQVVGAYVALLVAVLIFSRLNWVSLSAMAVILVEAPFVLLLLGAIRAGKDVHRGIKSAFRVLQLTVGVFVVSVTWDWLGATHGYLGLVVIVGVLQGMAIGLEWAAPGAVFLAYAREGRKEDPGAR